MNNETTGARLSKRGILRLSAVLLGFLTLAVGGLSLVNSPWHKLDPATCMPDSCFCEASDDSLIRQPANTASSLLFVAIAFAVAARPYSRWKSAAGSPRVYSWIYAAALAVIGFGSAFFHASLSFVGQTIDVFGIYLLVTFLLLHSFSRFGLPQLGPPRPGQRRTSRSGLTAVPIVYVSMNVVLLAGLATFPELRRHLVALLVVAVLLLELRWKVGGGRGDLRWLAAALLALSAGFAIWWLDLSGIACRPESLLQGHAVWHAMSAAAAALMYAYVESTAAPASAAVGNQVSN